MTGRGEQIRAFLEEQRFPAHLSGLDVLSQWCRHLFFRHPHLVISSKGWLTEVKIQLSRTFDVVCVHDRRTVATQSLDDLDDLVVVYPWPDYVSASIDVHYGVSSQPRAWVETYAAVQAGTYPLPAAELGHMLLVAGGQGEALEQTGLLAATPAPLQEELERLFARQPMTSVGREVLAGWEPPSY